MLNGNLIREKRKRLKLSVEQLSEHLGIKAENLYKWEKGTKITDMEAYRRLESWLKGEVENVPREIGNISSNSSISDSKTFYGHEISMASYTDLIQINKNLSLAQLQAEQRAKIDAEARKELIAQNETLTRLLEEERAINLAVRKESQTDRRNLAVAEILEQVARIGVKAGLYKSLDQAAGILNIPLESLTTGAGDRRKASRSLGKM